MSWDSLSFVGLQAPLRYACASKDSLGTASAPTAVHPRHPPNQTSETRAPRILAGTEGDVSALD